MERNKRPNNQPEADLGSKCKTKAPQRSRARELMRRYSSHLGLFGEPLQFLLSAMHARQSRDTLKKVINVDEDVANHQAPDGVTA